MAKGITVPVVQSGLEASIEAAAKKAGPLTLSASVDPGSFKRLAQPLGRVSGLATEFEKSIAASNARVIAFGASVGIINGVQNAFATLVKTTIEVEKSLANIAVISGKTTQELEPFSRALFEIAKTTSQSFQTASEAALEFSRQGLGLEETLKRTQDALTLTRFTTLSAAEAVDVLTAAANSFGATGITTSEILNKLVAVDTKFAVSAEDLAKGLSRAGSIAQEVGVSFDELNAIVTIAQERTARGGAVIGNAFKTIFTRIRSDETIKALQSIGIYSFDAEGRLRPVVSLLEELAGKINTLSETKRIEVLEAIASKYNINVLTALVDDLGSTASKFREARDVSAGAQSEAYQRQIELNQTLDAVITRVTNSAAQLADTLGRIGVTDSLKSLLNFFDNILTGINDVIDSEGIGGTIAKGLISGLSGVFFKIGIPLLLAIFVKLTKDIAQFGAESLKTILGINKEVRERQALEQAVVNTLIKDQQVMATILSLSGDRRKQEEYLLSVYNRQLAALQQVQTIAAGVAPALQAAGLSATSGTVKRRAAEGYLPAAEAKDVRRGVGGASPSSKVVEIPNFSFGGGKRGTMVANTSEYIVPNYGGGSGTAIFNQDMAREYGLPPGAKKITAAGGFVPINGFVPNYADNQPKNIKAIQQGKKFEKNLNLKLFGEKSYAANAVLDFPKPEGFGADSQTKAQLGISPQSEYGDAKRTQSKKSEKSLLDKYLRTPEGSQEFLKAKETTRGFINLSPEGLSMLFLEEGQDAKKIAYLGTKESILSEKTKDLIKTKFGGTKASKTIAMPYIADKINKTALFEKKASTGYVPNFAKEIGPRKIVDSRGIAGMIVPDKNNERVMEAYLNSSLGFETKPKTQDKTGIYYVKYHTYGLNEAAFEGEALKKGGDITNIEADVQKFGLDIAKKYSYKYASEYSRSLGGSANGVQISDEDVKKSFLASKGAVSGFSSLGGGIFETAIRTGVQGEINKDLIKAQQTELGAGKLDFKVTDVIKRLFGVNRGETEVDSKIEGNPKSTGRSLADQIVENNLYKYERTLGVAGSEKGKAAAGYIPNFAEQFKKQQEVLAPSGQFYDLDTADKFLAASNISLETSSTGEKGLGQELKQRILASAKKVYGSRAQIGISRLPGRREAFTSAVLNNPALADDFIALQKATTGGIGPVANTPEALAKFNNPTPFDPTPWPAVRAVGGKTRSIKKVGPRSLNAAVGYIPNFADLFVDYDYTIFGQQLGKATDFNSQKALIKNIPEDQMTEQERQARDAQMKLLTPFGQKLLQSKKPFKLATARWNDYQPGIESSLKGLGFNVNGVFALGREFSEEQYKVDNPKFAEEMKKPEGERNTRVKPRIEPSAAQKKALFFKERAPQIASGDIDFVDNDPANLQAVKSLMPKINTFTPDQYTAKLLAPQEVKGKKASLGYIPNFASQNALDAMRRIIADPAAPQGEKDAAASKLAQLSKVTSSGNPRTTAQKTIKAKLPITEEDKAYLNQNKEKITAGMGRSFGMLFNLDALEIGDLNYVRRLDPVIAKKLSEIIQKQGGRDSIRSLIDFGSAARGYIPNFADNEPLKEALNREVAAGVPPARVRVTQDKRLKNPKNPNGLAVINTRDEPNGKIPSDFRERGMRAAMASRGFVPNFAETVKLEGAKSFTKENSETFPSKELARLRAVLNQAIATYEEEIKSGKDLTEAKKKLDEATKKATAEAKLSKESSAKVESAVQKSAGRIQAQPQNDSRKIDIGKFLLLQTAVAGATSALQSFTDQGSNLSNVVEGVSAGLSGVSTFVSLIGSVNLPMRIFLGAVTALASAAPLISRFFESQKTPAEKAAESLSKLADEAEKTGKALTPEAILSAFENEQQTAKTKEEVKTVSSQVRDYLKAQNIEATDQQVKILSAALLANPQGVQREGGIAKKINEQELGGLVAQTSEKVEVKTGLKRGSFNTEINEGRLTEQVAKKSKEQLEASRRRLANTEDLSRLSEEEKKKIQEANEIENARQRVLNSLFATQLNINSVYEASLRASNNIVAALERQRGLLTEAEFITAKGNQEKAKSQAELDKTNKLIIEDLKKNLGAGSNESLLGPNAQKFFNVLKPEILENLLTEFEKGGGNVEQSNKAFKAFVGALKDAGANVEGLTNLSVLGPKGSTTVTDFFRGASQAKKQAEAQKKNVDANTDSTTANELASTELRKLQGATAENTAILQGTSGIIAGTGVRFDGLKKYIELLGIEQEKYKKSIVDLKLKNQLEIDSAEDKIEAEIEGTELRNQHSALMRKILGVDRAAEMAASNLVEETSKRVFELAAQSKNAGLKLNTDIEILDAETNLINAYNEVYKGSIQEDDARSKLANALAKSKRSEQEKDTELKVQIGLIRKSWETEGKDIERKIELAEKRAILIKDIDYSKRAELELRSEALNLAEARRKAAANLEKNNLDLSVRNKIISNETRNLEEIKNIITEGRALTTAGVQSSFEQQARAAVVERRLAGRKNIDLRESTNILTGRDNSIQQNLEIQKGVLLDQAETFQQIIGNQTPKLFADGMAEAMQAALNQADDLGGALRNVALNFLKSLQSAFLQSASRQIVASILPTGAAKGGYVKGYATGGLVTGGSGYKDDVPAMLSEGEYVIRKSSVKKYGASNLQKLNSGEAPKFAAGGIFLPGIRGQTEISGYKDLTAFAKQTTTSGATDVLAGGATTAFANLEDQSSRLSAYALMREDDTINQEIRSAQEQAMNIMAEREAYRTAERKAFQKQLVGTVASAALSYGINAGIGKLGSLFNSAAPVPKEMSNLINDSGFDYSNFGNIGYQAAGKTVDQGLSFGNFADGAAGVLKSIPSYQAPRTQSIYSNTRTRMLGSKGYPFMAYGGAVKRYNAGGPTDDIPALLMGGEYVMNRQATKKYGKQFFDSINQGRAPRFADGGQVSTAEPSFAEKAATSSDSKAAGATNVSININVTGGTSDTQTQGDTKQGGIDYKKMSEQIKQVVIQTINEEKRLGGSLRSR